MRLEQQRMPAQCWNGVRLLFGGTLAELGAGWLLGRRRPIAAARGRSVGQYCPRCTLRPSIIGRLPHGGPAHQADPRGETTKACELVAPESAAARYVMHQQLMTDAEKITGYASEPETPKIDPDPATGAIKIKYNDDPKTKYTWKDFTLDQGQDHRLDWQDRTREVRAVVAYHHRSIHGREAKLKSAYLSNGKALSAIVELSSGTATSWGNAE